MIGRLVAVLIVSATLAGCATSSRAPLQVSRGIAVLPANNLTGDPLLVAGTGLIDRYVRHAGAVSVADVLQSEARAQLQEKGFDVGEWTAQPSAVRGAAPNGVDAAVALARQSGIKNTVLYLEVVRWEPDAPTHTRFVVVGLIASLVDPVTGRELWHEHRKAAPVGTPGVITLESAYVVAARKVIAEILAPLRPEPPPAK